MCSLFLSYFERGVAITMLTMITAVEVVCDESLYGVLVCYSRCWGRCTSGQFAVLLV